MPLAKDSKTLRAETENMFPNYFSELKTMHSFLKGKPIDILFYVFIAIVYL